MGNNHKLKIYLSVFNKQMDKGSIISALCWVDRGYAAA